VTDENIFRSVFKEEMGEFLALRQSAKSKGTADHDRHYLQLFDGYLCSVRHVEREVPEEVVTGWVASLGFSAATAAGAVNTTRCFLRHLRGCGISAYVPPRPRCPESYTPYVFSDHETDLIFRNADSFTSGKSKRLPCIKAEIPMLLRLLLGCGLRLGEAVSLKVGDIDAKAGALTLKNTKNSKERLVPMRPELAVLMDGYCLAMGISGNPSAWLFPGATPETHLTKMDVWHRFDTILRKSGISLPGRRKFERGPCLHCLRHLFVLKSFKYLEANGFHVDDAIPYLSIYLGHAGLNETQKYMRFSGDMFPDEIGRFAAFADGIFPEVHHEE